MSGADRTEALPDEFTASQHRERDTDSSPALATWMYTVVVWLSVVCMDRDQ